MKLTSYAIRTKKRLLSVYPNLKICAAFYGELRIFDDYGELKNLINFVNDHNAHRNRALFLQIIYMPCRPYLSIVFSVSKPKYAIYVSL